MSAGKEDDIFKVKIGINILETLTTGMYRNPMVMYREYIQNSADAIDKAIEFGIITHDEGQIDIWIENNQVCIEDNGIGIKANDFISVLYSIGESTKNIDVDKGFRGIGHWCGFANCDKLRFIAKYSEEQFESIMICDAAKMRRMMNEHRTHSHTYTIDDVLKQTITFDIKKVEDISDHYFKVELEGINDKSLYNLQKVKDYLSFVAPVGYATEFPFRDSIKEYSRTIGYTIPQYSIRINGEQILKKYQSSFETGKGQDRISSIKFVPIKDDNGEIIAWMWFGVSRFMAQISCKSKMRGIRLRCKNIQLGAENTLQHLFSENSGRGLYYFIGEVFAISKKLIPDSQRDYFEPGADRDKFDTMLSKLFSDNLSKIYHYGSEINSALDKYEKLYKQLGDTKSPTCIPDNVEPDNDKELEEFIKSKGKLDKVKKRISTSPILNEIKDEINNNVESQYKNNAISKPTNLKQKKEIDSTQKTSKSAGKSKDSKMHENDKTVPLNKIIDIIKNVLPKDMAEIAIKAIIKMSRDDAS